MKDIFEEKPEVVKVSEEYAKNYYHASEMDAWLESMKAVLDSQHKVLDELNSHGLIVWDTFIGFWVFPAHLKGIKEKAEKLDAITLQYGITGDHLVSADEIIHDIEGTKLLKEEWEALKKVEAIKIWISEVREYKTDMEHEPQELMDELEKILGGQTSTESTT